MALRGLARSLGRSLLKRQTSVHILEPLQLLLPTAPCSAEQQQRGYPHSTSSAMPSDLGTASSSFQANYGVAARQVQNDQETYRVSVITGNLRGELCWTEAWGMESSTPMYSSYRYDSMLSTLLHVCRCWHWLCSICAAHRQPWGVRKVPHSKQRH